MIYGCTYHLPGKFDELSELELVLFFHSYLIASMGLQVIWSFGLAVLDAYALLRKKVTYNPITVSLFVVGDWVGEPLINFPEMSILPCYYNHIYIIIRILPLNFLTGHFHSISCSSLCLGRGKCVVLQWLGPLQFWWGMPAISNGGRISLYELDQQRNLIFSNALALGSRLDHIQNRLMVFFLSCSAIVFVIPRIPLIQ